MYMNADPWSTWMSNIQENSAELCTNLRFCQKAAEFEKTSKIPNFLQKIYFFLLKNVNCNQRSTFLVYFLSILNIYFIKNSFPTKNWP